MAVMVDWRGHIVVDPKIFHGKARIKGTRIITVSVITRSLTFPEGIADTLRDGEDGSSWQSHALAYHRGTG